MQQATCGREGGASELADGRDEDDERVPARLIDDVRAAFDDHLRDLNFQKIDEQKLRTAPRSMSRKRKFQEGR